LNVIWVLIPVFLAAVTIGILAIYLSREKRAGRQGDLNRPGQIRHESVVQHLIQADLNNHGIRPTQSNPPMHRVGRIEVPRYVTPRPDAGENIVLGASAGNKLCPYCMKLIEPQDVFTCPACKSAHHKECWETYKGCSVLACKLAPVKSQ